MKYYRTYVFTIQLSDGIKYYAGKRISKFENPVDDYYSGSGTIIKAAFKKYGRSIFIDREWHDHQTRELMEEFEELLVDECKEKYGEQCVNIAKGGCRGYVYAYASETDKINRNHKISESNKGRKFSDLHRNNISVSCKGKTLKPFTESHRLNISKSGLISQNKPETREKRIKSQRLARRTSAVWQNPLFSTLYNAWNSTSDKNGNKLKCRRFAVHLSNTGIYNCADNDIGKLLKHFNDVLNGVEPLWKPVEL